MPLRTVGRRQRVYGRSKALYSNTIAYLFIIKFLIKMKNKFLILFAAFILFSCEGEISSTDGVKSTAKAGESLEGTWKVTSYKLNEMESISRFQPYTIHFGAYDATQKRGECTTIITYKGEKNETKQTFTINEQGKLAYLNKDETAMLKGVNVTSDYTISENTLSLKGKLGNIPYMIKAVRQ